MPAPEPREDTLWRYDSPFGDSVVVRFRDGHWYSASTPASPYYRDDNIPTWPGTFTVAGTTHRLNKGQ